MKNNSKHSMKKNKGYKGRRVLPMNNFSKKGKLIFPEQLHKSSIIIINPVKTKEPYIREQI